MKRISFFTTTSFIGLICLFVLVAGDDNCDACYTPKAMLARIFVCGLVIIGLSVYFTHKYQRTEDIIFNIENQPLLETNEATEGVPFACEGTVAAESTIESEFTKTPCVYYHSILEKLVQSGKNKKWQVVRNVARYAPFYIKDERGRIGVDLANMDDDFTGHEVALASGSVPNPRNSEIDCEPVIKKSIFKEVTTGWLFNKSTKFRQSKYVLRPDTKVFVYGYAAKRDDGLFLREHENHPLIISKKTQMKYVEEFYKGERLIYYVHLFVLVGYIISLYSLSLLVHINDIAFSFLFAAGILLIGGSVAFTMYNRMIKLKNRALSALSDTEGELCRRANLIPVLVKTVRVYAEHEQKIMRAIATLRSTAVYGEKPELAPKTPGNNLIILAENYPDLKASPVFHNLMINLTDTEERIAYSREFYNRTIRKYNTLIGQFPFFVIAALVGMKNMLFLNLGGEPEDR